MNTTKRYNENELTEVADFLRTSYIRATSRVASARARDPKMAVRSEVERLRQLPANKKGSVSPFTDLQLEEIVAAVESQFARELGNLKVPELEKLRKESDQQTSIRATGPQRLALILLKNISLSVCGERKPPTLKNITITTASLSLLLGHLKIDPVLAPCAVWVATFLRDKGTEVFCGSVKDYLASKGVD